jgi:hypothetical protein
MRVSGGFSPCLHVGRLVCALRCLPLCAFVGMAHAFLSRLSHALAHRHNCLSQTLTQEAARLRTQLEESNARVAALSSVQPPLHTHSHSHTITHIDLYTYSTSLSLSLARSLSFLYLYIPRLCVCSIDNISLSLSLSVCVWGGSVARRGSGVAGGAL